MSLLLSQLAPGQAITAPPLIQGIAFGTASIAVAPITITDSGGWVIREWRNDKGRPKRQRIEAVGLVSQASFGTAGAVASELIRAAAQHVRAAGFVGAATGFGRAGVGLGLDMAGGLAGFAWGQPQVKTGPAPALPGGHITALEMAVLLEIL